ncbi:MAG TPA: methyltransferase domain-containing protein [Acidimicrobiia bacterium]
MPSRFLDTPRAYLREAYWGHPLAHIIRELHHTLAGLAADLNLLPGSTVVDYGCADMKYRELFPADVNYVAADLPGNPDATIELEADGSLPLRDATVDAVFSSQVLEHVPDPSRYLAECVRVLRPGGTLLLSTHGIMVYHRDPVDYWRWTGEGLQHIIDDAGFELVRFEGVMGLAATGLQLFQDGTCHKVPRRLQATYLGVMQTLVGAFDHQSAASRAENALVYALIARKPVTTRPITEQKVEHDGH